MATYNPELDFATICSEYVDGCSTEDIQSLRESMLPHERLVADQVSAQWVMDARHEDMAGSACRGDIAQPTDSTEPGLEGDINRAECRPAGE